MSHGKKREWLHKTAGKLKHFFGQKSTPEHKVSSKDNDNDHVNAQTRRHQQPHQGQLNTRQSEDQRASEALEQLQKQQKSPERAKSPESNRVWNMPTTYLASALAAPPPKPTELPTIEAPTMDMAESTACEPQQRDQHHRPARDLDNFWNVPAHYLASMLQAPPPRTTDLPLSEEQHMQIQKMQQQRIDNRQQKSRQGQQQLPLPEDDLLQAVDVAPRLATDAPLRNTMPVRHSAWTAPHSPQREQELSALQREREREREREELAMQAAQGVLPRFSTHDQLLRRVRDRQREHYYLEKELREREMEYLKEPDKFPTRNGVVRDYYLEKGRAQRRSVEIPRDESREFGYSTSMNSLRDLRDSTPYHERQSYDRYTERRLRTLQSSPRARYDRALSYERVNEALREPYMLNAPYYSSNPHGYEPPMITRDKSKTRGYWELRAYSEQRSDGRCDTCVDTRRSQDRPVHNLERTPTVENGPDRPDRRSQAHLQKTSSMRRAHATSPPTLLADEDDRFSSDSASQISFTDKAYDIQAQKMIACEIRDREDLDDENDEVDTLRWFDPPPMRTNRGYIEENDYLPPKMPPPPRPDVRRRMKAAEKHRHLSAPPPVRTPFNLPSLLPPFRLPIPPTTYEAF